MRYGASASKIVLVAPSTAIFDEAPIAGPQPFRSSDLAI
jgi:hypothetical protein